MNTTLTIAGRGTTFLLGQLGHVTVKGVKDALAEFGLHPRQYAVLATLSADPGISQQSLSDRLLVHRSAMVGLIDELEKRGLVSRERRAENRREHALVLTDDGRELLNKLRGLSAEYEQHFLEPLNEEESKQLLSLLTRLAIAQGVALPAY